MSGEKQVGHIPALPKPQQLHPDSSIAVMPTHNYTNLSLISEDTPDKKKKKKIQVCRLWTEDFGFSQCEGDQCPGTLYFWKSGILHRHIPQQQPSYGPGTTDAGIVASDLIYNMLHLQIFQY